MGGVGQVLELMHGARGRYRTVHGVLRQRSSGRLTAQAQARLCQQSRRPAPGELDVQVFSMEGPQPERRESVMRFWSDSPRVREESEILLPQRYASVYVRNCDRWWMHTAERGTVSDVVAEDTFASMGVGEGLLWQSLLDPASWIPSFDFHLDGKAELLGRRALRVGAVARRRDFLVPFPLALQHTVGAEAYELLVDCERGAVLRAAALFDGAEFWAAEFEELCFDEDLPPERFVFEPSPGDEVRVPESPSRDPVTIEQAAERVPFAVFHVPELPDGHWHLSVLYVPPPVEPSPRKESVQLIYSRADARAHFGVTQRVADPSEPPWPALVRVERDGVALDVARPVPGLGAPTHVLFERDGTTIQVSSPSLEEELLLELAASMEKV